MISLNTHARTPPHDVVEQDAGRNKKTRRDTRRGARRRRQRTRETGPYSRRPTATPPPRRMTVSGSSSTSARASRKTGRLFRRAPSTDPGRARRRGASGARAPGRLVAVVRPPPLVPRPGSAPRRDARVGAPRQPRRVGGGCTASAAGRRRRGRLGRRGSPWRRRPAARRVPRGAQPRPATPRVLVGREGRVAPPPLGWPRCASARRRPGPHS